MFSRFIAITLIISLVGANLSRFVVYAGFSANQKYIAQNLCINKNRPWLHCNGHCYLMQKVKQAEENEKKQTAKDNLSRLEVSFFQQNYRIDFAPIGFKIDQTGFPVFHQPYSNCSISAVYQPPKPLV